MTRPPPSTVTTNRNRAKAALTRAAVSSLAPTNRGRWGVTRNDVVTVLCRNSLVTMRVPSNRAKR